MDVLADHIGGMKIEEGPPVDEAVQTLLDDPEEGLESLEVAQVLDRSHGVMPPFQARNATRDNHPRSALTADRLPDGAPHSIDPSGSSARRGLSAWIDGKFVDNQLGGWDHSSDCPVSG